MIEALQYFSADNCTARATFPGSRFRPETVKWMLMVVNTCGGVSARCAVNSVTQPVTSWRDFARMLTTS